MNYANHNLRTQLQEWKNRLYRAPSEQFGHQLKYLINNLNQHIQIQGLINEACIKYVLTKEQYDDFSEMMERGSELSFENEIHQTAFCWQFLKHFISGTGDYNLHRYTIFQCREFDNTRSKIIEALISPIIYYLHDRLDKSNSVIFLLEKYKRRTEWFTKKLLYKKYQEIDHNYEQLFEDDLRLFLFDQGIDYPFSTPLSATGRADIIGEIETDDPLVVEIKIFDRTKNYGKDRIKDGFTQIVKYANDYNKDVGYLVIYNLDKGELNLNFSEKTKIFPPSINFNNKVFYFIIINAAVFDTASKSGTITQIEITENELTNK